MRRFYLASVIMIAGFILGEITDVSAHCAAVRLPNTLQIKNDILRRLPSKHKSVTFVHTSGSYALVDYRYGETSGDALYIVSDNKWKFSCAMAGAIDAHEAQRRCGVPAARVEALFH